MALPLLLRDTRTEAMPRIIFRALLMSGTIALSSNVTIMWVDWGSCVVAISSRKLISGYKSSTFFLIFQIFVQ